MKGPTKGSYVSVLNVYDTISLNHPGSNCFAFALVSKDYLRKKVFRNLVAGMGPTK
jgi:hypothetical protein